ncbi:TPA: ABC transporter [Stenotrophomonas maltophilia]|nr:ABC transporter [Stenotrophomonas maltophilia]
MKEHLSYERGSEWRQWDLHVHTPASFHWLGPKFDRNADSAVNKALVDEMISAMNAADPAVFALMDYWTFEGWFALQRRQKDKEAPKLTKKVFPGIELRLVAPMPGRLNAHVLFSDELEEQVLRDFLGTLRLALSDRPLSDAALIDLSRNHIGAPKLKLHGFDKEKVDADDAEALRAGATVAEVTAESYKAAIARVPEGQAVGYMPYDTSDGLADVKWQDHYGFFLGLVRNSAIFESRNLDLRGAFVNEATPGNAKYIADFQRGLGGTPRLVVSGSDAHQFVGVPGDNDRRGYGDFPSGKITWIKADPTFRGLQQALREPAKRSFIGAIPPKLEEVAANKTYFIDSIAIDKEAGSNPDGDWLSGIELPLNCDLVAIIGNKGSGKSALADVIALVGNSRQSAHFSFLKRDRFRGKSGDPAKHFLARVTWADGTGGDRNLNQDPPPEKVELVRYIPQGHFEALCNAHVSGKSDAFESELRSVIFSHADDAIRLGALDFEQLIEQQEKTFRQQLNEFRKDLRRVNQEIVALEDQLQPGTKSALEEQLALKKRQLEDYQKSKPEEIVKPADQLDEDQVAASAVLEEAAGALALIDEERRNSSAKISMLAARSKAAQNVREHLRMIQRSYEQFKVDTEADLEVLGVPLDSVLKFGVSLAPVEEATLAIAAEQASVKVALDQAAAQRDALLERQADARAKLNAPQQAYQHYLQILDDWKAKLAELAGSVESPDTLLGLEARIAQIDLLPAQLKERRLQRSSLAGDIYDILEAQRVARELLFKPVQDLIQGNSLIREDYKLQFRATLGGAVEAFATTLFTLMKQSVGEFRGEDESFGTVRKLAESFDFNARADALSFAEQLYEKIAVAASASGGKGAEGISAVMRKDKSASEIYDLVFGLSYLEPRYSLLFQDAQIEQLSPGQRGALLLIFYLLVDKGRTPIILDQPEENLDNETVVSLLVPVLTEAKKRRQIIMVTHNPNLAVVCDAEQIVWSHFDRKNRSKIAYTAGAIEDPQVNQLVINVLERTKPAFNNRRMKYH